MNNERAPQERIDHFNKPTVQASDLTTSEIVFARWLEAERRYSNHLQFQIDNLMLEYCPEEMTKEQIANWEKCQVPAEIEDE